MLIELEIFWLWKQGKYVQVICMTIPLIKNKFIVLPSQYFQIVIFTYTAEIIFEKFCLFKHFNHMKYCDGNATSRLQY